MPRVSSTSWINAERARDGNPTIPANPRSTSSKRDGAAMLTSASVRSPNCTASIALAPPMEWPTTACSGGSSAAASSVARAIQGNHRIAVLHQRGDQAGELGGPPFPTVHQQHRGALAPAQRRQAETQGDALCVRQQWQLPLTRR